MDINIKKYILDNFKDSDTQEIKESIIESIKSEDEVVLPGLGVLLELLWNNSDDSFKNNIVEKIHEEIKKAN